MTYNKISFGLSNAGATFQCAMDMAFHGLINKFVLVYLDDVTFFSKNGDQHLDHLIHISIDPKRITTMLALPLPTHKKGLQSFIGRINFIKWFIPNIATLMQPLSAILKKNIPFQWTKEGKNNFEENKEPIAEAPTLINPNFKKDFILYAFGSDDIISAVLCQQNDEGLEQPIAFCSRILHDYETRYSFVEKHVLAVIRNLKKFRHIVSNNTIQLMVAHHTAKEYLPSKDINDKRACWITKVMKYDISIKVTKAS